MPERNIPWSENQELYICEQQTKIYVHSKVVHPLKIQMRNPLINQMIRSEEFHLVAYWWSGLFTRTTSCVIFGKQQVLSGNIFCVKRLAICGRAWQFKLILYLALYSVDSQARDFNGHRLKYPLIYIIFFITNSAEPTFGGNAGEHTYLPSFRIQDHFCEF